jgi:AcrR family transcriptional regulator
MLDVRPIYSGGQGRFMGRKVVAPLRREQILNGLFAAMSRKGYESVSISDIASEAGVTRGILHYYFESKDEMLLELMRSISMTYLKRLQRYVDREKGAVDRLLAIVRFHTLGDEREVRELAGVWVEYWGKAAGGHDVGAVIADLQERMRGMIEAAIRDGIGDGTFARVDPASSATVMLGALEGILLQWRVSGSRIDLGRSLAELERIIRNMAGGGVPKKTLKGKGR